MSEHNKIQIVPLGDDPHNATIIIKQEDHTIGNALRYMVMKNDKVDFCGYTIPHPQENKIHVRVQTNPESDLTAVDAVKTGLKNIMDACDHILNEVITKLPQKFPEKEELESTSSMMDTN